MRVEIKIFDDQDQVVVEYKGDPSQPGQWRPQPGQMLTSKMPAQSDNQNTGTYELTGFTYQPHLRVARPNGYTAPVPGPNNGLPQNFPQPNSFPPPFGLTKPRLPGPPPFGGYAPNSMWNPSVPTAPPAQGGSPALTNQPLKEVKVL